MKQPVWVPVFSQYKLKWLSLNHFSYIYYMMLCSRIFILSFKSTTSMMISCSRYLNHNLVILYLQTTKNIIFMDSSSLPRVVTISFSDWCPVDIIRHTITRFALTFEWAPNPDQPVGVPLHATPPPGGRRGPVEEEVGGGGQGDVSPLSWPPATAASTPAPSWPAPSLVEGWWWSLVTTSLFTGG